MYDKAKADRAVEFIRNLRHTKGRWRGVPFTLLPWQEKIIRDIFGTVKPDGYRQYKTAYIEVPKKNGKSELAAAVALYLLFADKEPAAEIYSAAADRMQASIVFNVAASMVRMCPALEKRCKIIDSVKRIVVPSTESFYQVLSAEAYTKHGFNVHGVIFDELHAQPTRDLYDVLTDGSGDARTQPLFFLITTAGDDPDRTSICWEVHSYAKDVLEGRRVDDTFYPVIYGLEEDDDWKDEKNWYKANPSLGHTVKIETVREAFLKAIDNPAKERAFRQLRLNQWVKTKTSKWVSLEKWDACTSEIWSPEELRGRECFGGMDLSSKLDITAFVLLFPPAVDDSKWRVLWRFWIPEENMKERVRKDKVPYDRWVRNGYIKTTPGNVIDYDFIKADILGLRDLYDIKEIGYDPWNALQVALQLADEGLTMVEVRQTYKHMSPAMKELEKLIVSRRLEHGGNPVARWMFGNLEVKQDENDNIRPVKAKSTERIDGIVALINALARAILHEQPKRSVYEERGLLFL
ncbi:MAG: terminase large subunit [Desulfotomaculales bacterium]